MEPEVLMSVPGSDYFEPMTVGMEIPIPVEYQKDYVVTDYGTYYCIQHNHLRDHPTSGKLLVRDAGWRGALKAFVEGFDANNLPVALKVLRLSRSGKSVITRAIMK